MSKLMNGDGSYSCFECGTPSNAPYGDCPQCALVKIQRDSARAAQERFEQETQQREGQFRQMEMARNPPDYEGDALWRALRKYEANGGFMSEEDFPDTPSGRAEREKQRPRRERIRAEQRAKGIVPPCDRKSEPNSELIPFWVGVGEVLGGLIGVGSVLLAFWLLFQMVSCAGR